MLICGFPFPASSSFVEHGRGNRESAGLPRAEQDLPPQERRVPAHLAEGEPAVSSALQLF